jgi:hypothetical protein
MPRDAGGTWLAKNDGASRLSAVDRGYFYGRFPANRGMTLVSFDLLTNMVEGEAVAEELAILGIEDDFAQPPEPSDDVAVPEVPELDPDLGSYVGEWFWRDLMRAPPGGIRRRVHARDFKGELLREKRWQPRWNDRAWRNLRRAPLSPAARERRNALRRSPAYREGQRLYMAEYRARCKAEFGRCRDQLEGGSWPT